MKLTACPIPKFESGNHSADEAEWRASRKIFRCQIPGCPCVAPAPMTAKVQVGRNRHYMENF